MSPVCGTCGVVVGAARTGRFVHLDDIPKGIDPDHAIEAVPESDFFEREDRRVTLKGAAEDMLAHHATLHPSSDCPWASVLERALKSA